MRGTVLARALANGDDSSRVGFTLQGFGHFRCGNYMRRTEKGNGGNWKGR